MQNRDREAFQSLLSDAMAFYRQDVSTFALSVWWAACERFSLGQVTKALTAHAMDPERGQFPPKPADVVRALQGTYTDRALLAWGRVYGALGSVGAYQSINFGDAAIHAAIEDMGGWVVLCRSTVDELPFLQRRFCETYRAYGQRPDVREIPYLRGETEAVNALTGRGHAAPVSLGVHAPAQQQMLAACERRTPAAQESSHG